MYAVNIHWPRFGSATCSARTMMGNAGSMASMAMAWVAIMAATSATNSVNPSGAAWRSGIDSGLGLACDAGRHGDDGGEIREVRRHHQCRSRLCQFAELLHVLFADPQLHGFDAAAVGKRDADLPQAFGRGGRHRQDGLRLALGLVDLLLFARLGLLDHALLVAFGGVDLCIALAFGGEHHGALLALGAHLLLHGLQHVLGRRDVLDLVAQYLDAPGRRSLVQFTDDIGVDLSARL